LFNTEGLVLVLLLDFNHASLQHKVVSFSCTGCADLLLLRTVRGCHMWFCR